MKDEKMITKADVLSGRKWRDQLGPDSDGEVTAARDHEFTSTFEQDALNGVLVACQNRRLLHTASTLYKSVYGNIGYVNVWDNALSVNCVGLH